MTAKSADLFGTFLDTVANTSLGSLAQTQSDVVASNFAIVPQSSASPMTEVQARANIANEVIKYLAEQPKFMGNFKELLPVAKDSYTALVEALSELSSYGLVTNENGQISLSQHGSEIARITRTTT